MYVFMIEGVPTVWGDKDLVEDCFRDTSFNENYDDRDMEVAKLSPRDPMFKRIKKAQRLACSGKSEEAAELLGWRD
jgi:hypothetical protein